MKVLQTDLSLETHRLRNVLGGVEDYDASTLLQSEHSKSISILSPQNADDIALFYTRYAITMQAVRTVLRGTSVPSVLFTVRHDTDRNAAGTALVNGQTASSTTTGDNITVADTTVPAGSWVWLEVTTVGGTVSEFHLTMFYRVDA